MRTTLDIDNDILQAAKEIAMRDRTTAGSVISRLARAALSPSPKTEQEVKNGVPIFPARPGELVTLEHVRRIMEEERV